MRLKGQVIAVTGSDQGYGRSLSSALARAGASLILIGNHPESLATHASSIEQAGGVAIPMQADVSLLSNWRGALGHILEIFGTLSGAVHLADRRSHSEFTMLSENEWTELFQSNVKSTVGITQLMQRTSPESWLTIIGPHLDERSLQAHIQRGSLRSLVEQGAEELRLNMLLPSRASSDEDNDQPLLSAAVMLADPEMHHLRGSILEIPLSDVPKGKAPSEATWW